MRKLAGLFIATMSLCLAPVGGAVADGMSYSSQSLEGIYEKYYNRILSVCVEDARNILDCDQALRDYAKLADIETVMELDEVAALPPEQREAFLAEFAEMVASAEFQIKFNEMQTSLYARIKSAHHNSDLFLYGIDDALLLCTGISYLASTPPTDPSPTLPG